MNKIKLTQQEFDELQLAYIENDTLMLTEDMTALTNRIFIDTDTIDREALDELFVAKYNPELIEIIDNDPLPLNTKVTAIYNDEFGNDLYLLKNNKEPGVLFGAEEPIDNEGFMSVFTIGELIGLGLAESVRMDIVEQEKIYLTRFHVDEMNSFKMKYTLPFFAMAEAMDNVDSVWNEFLLDDYDNAYIYFLKVWFNEIEIIIH